MREFHFVRYLCLAVVLLFTPKPLASSLDLHPPPLETSTSIDFIRRPLLALRKDRFLWRGVFGAYLGLNIPLLPAQQVELDRLLVLEDPSSLFRRLYHFCSNSARSNSFTLADPSFVDAISSFRDQIIFFNRKYFSMGPPDMHGIRAARDRMEIRRQKDLEVGFGIQTLRARLNLIINQARSRQYGSPEFILNMGNLLQNALDRHRSAWYAFKSFYRRVKHTWKKSTGRALRLPRLLHRLKRLERRPSRSMEAEWIAADMILLWARHQIKPVIDEAVKQALVWSKAQSPWRAKLMVQMLQMMAEVLADENGYVVLDAIPDLHAELP